MRLRNWVYYVLAIGVIAVAIFAGGFIDAL